MTLLAAFSSVFLAAALLVSGFGDARVLGVGHASSVAVSPPVNAAAGSPNAPAMRRDTTPLYTEEQATTGEALFGRVCVECHEKRNVTSVDFRAKWTGRPILDLYELIRTTMPDSNPGGLSRDEYAGALAYILKLNGLPAGATPVMPDSVAMRLVKVDFPPPSP